MIFLIIAILRDPLKKKEEEKNTAFSSPQTHKEEIIHIIFSD